jgi:hypothetical protein
VLAVVKKEKQPATSNGPYKCLERVSFWRYRDSEDLRDREY